MGRSIGNRDVPSRWGRGLIAGHLRLLFMGGRGIQAVTRQNCEPHWIAYLGVQILLGPKKASDTGRTERK